MARETVIPSVSVEVVKEVVPPSPAATGIVAILGTTEKGPLLKPTRIGRFPEFIEEFGVGSAYSMPEAKQALQNGAKELVIVRLGDREKNKASGSREFIELASKVPSPEKVLKLEARAEGIWGNEIEVKVSESKSKVTGTYKIDLFYQSEEPLETFDNVTMHPGNPRYLVSIINSESKLVTAEDFTGKFPSLMDKSKTLSGGTNGVKSSIKLEGKIGGKGNPIPMIVIKSKEIGKSGDDIQITVESVSNDSADSTDMKKITVSLNTAMIAHEVSLNPSPAENYILEKWKDSQLIEVELCPFGKCA